MVVVATFHTAAGKAVMDELIEFNERPREVDAVSTWLFVFALMTEAREDEATPTLLSVFALTTAATEEDAVCTSLRVARLPEVSPAPVRVRVPYDQISATVSEPPPTVEIGTSIFVASTFPIEPIVVMVEVATFHTAAGRAVIDEAIELREKPSEVDAVSTVASVFAFMTAARDEVAMPTRVSVFAFIAP